jgi:hypothetical protein
MKKLLNILYEFCLSIGEARAAAAMVRAGLHKEAQTLMASK